MTKKEFRIIENLLTKEYKKLTNLTLLNQNSAPWELKPQIQEIINTAKYYNNLIYARILEMKN